jgi:hypothetical protein
METPMKKNTVIRHDAPHSVKMQEGSNVAEHKFKKPALSKEPEIPASIKKPVKSTATATPTSAKPPARSAAKSRAKVNLKTQPTAAPVLPEPDQPLNEKPAVAVSPMEPIVLSEADLWERESPINHRLSELRTRNALLNEQLQRLKPPFQARGKKS